MTTMFCTRALGATMLMTSLVTAAWAQNYPSQSVRIVAPFGAGGGGDTTIRLLGIHLSQALGQAVVVDNRPGANGVIGAQEARGAVPDGHTLFYGSTTTLAANASLMKKLPYDAVKDFTPVSRVGTLPFILVVHPGLPVNTVAELIAYARANPDTVSYASANAAGQVSGAIFARMAGIRLLNVPYKASPAALVDVLSGRVSMMFVDIPPAIAHVNAGKLRVLGVTTATRSALLPQVPAIAEAGLPGYELIGWTALAVPAGTRPDIVARLHAEVVKLLAKPEVKDAFARVGVETGSSTPEALASFIVAEREKWAQMVKLAGIEPE